MIETKYERTMVLTILLYCFIYVHVGLTALFTNFEPSQSLGVTEMGDLLQKSPHHRKRRTLFVSHVTRARLEPIAVTPNDFETSSLNHSATGAAITITV